MDEVRGDREAAETQGGWDDDGVRDGRGVPGAAGVPGAREKGKAAVLVAGAVASELTGMPVLPVVADPDELRRGEARHWHDKDATTGMLGSSEAAAVVVAGAQDELESAARAMLPDSALEGEALVVEASIASLEDTTASGGRRVVRALHKLAQSSADYHMLARDEEQGGFHPVRAAGDA